MSQLTRRGFTAAEMLVSLFLTGAVLGLATHAVVGQMRFLSGVGEVTRLRAELARVDGVTRSMLWAASPADLVVAQDSAIELRATIGSAVVCASDTGWLVVSAPSAPEDGNTLSSFSQAPDAGDRLFAIAEDSTGHNWLPLTVNAAPGNGQRCPAAPDIPAWSLAIREPIRVAPRAVIRVVRPIRVSLYRSSIGSWYLGARDWNNSTGRFNAIQPVAGPLRPYSRTASLSGLAFIYLDSSGTQLPPPVQTAAVAAVTIISRADTRLPVRGTAFARDASGVVTDSLSVTIALRNRP